MNEGRRSRPWRRAGRHQAVLSSALFEQQLFAGIFLGGVGVFGSPLSATCICPGPPGVGAATQLSRVLIIHCRTPTFYGSQSLSACLI